VRASDAVAAAPSSRAVRYAPCVSSLDREENSSSHVYLHPRSALRAAAPEWLVYTELLATGLRPYAMGATAVDPAWLPSASPVLTSLAPQPLPEPAAAYDAASDAVVAWHSATFGPAMWPLPAVRVPLPDCESKFAAFGAALLAGAVLPPMAELRDKLATSAESCGRAECRGQRRVGELVHALRCRGCASRARLAQLWAVEPRWLVAERIWPAMLAAAAGGGAAASGKKRRARG
jgi:ATP-dependent RNA helicase DHX37/DHR1